MYGVPNRSKRPRVHHIEEEGERGLESVVAECLGVAGVVT